MGAFTITAVKSVVVGGPGACKRAVIKCTGPASYDAGGSVIDMSSANTVLTGLNNEAAFATVFGMSRLAVSPATSDIYASTFTPGSSDAPATGTVKLRDLTATSDAEASGDLHTTTFTFEVFGT